MRQLRSMPLALAALVTACSDTDPAVFVDAELTGSNAELVGSSALGVGLRGSAVLTLHLGSRASGTSSVTAEAFAMVSADQSAEVIPALPVTATPVFPASVAPDSDVAVTLAFDTGTDPLPTATRDALCAPGGVRLKVVLQDSLQSGGATPVVSEPFVPSGC